MNCRDLQEGGLLDALAPGHAGPDRWTAVPEGVREAARRHLELCADCQAALEGLVRLRREAAGLPGEIEPPHDLWPAIAARLTAGERPERPRTRSGRTLRAGLLVAAAAGLAALVIAPAWRGGPAPGFGTGAGTADLVSLNVTGAGFEQAERELRSVYDARRENLAPETVAEVERNLRIIEGALEAMRVALVRDPNNLVIGQEYRRVHRQKLDLLRAAARISSQT